jgi:hypothetical protein
LLQGTNGPHDLHPDAFVIYIANNPAVRLIDGDVGQRAQFVPVAGPSLSRRSYSNVHGYTAENDITDDTTKDHTAKQTAGQNPIRSILSPAGSIVLVTTMVPSSFVRWILLPHWECGADFRVQSE